MSAFSLAVTFTVAMAAPSTGQESVKPDDFQVRASLDMMTLATETRSQKRC